MPTKDVEKRRAQRRRQYARRRENPAWKQKWAAQWKQYSPTRRLNRYGLSKADYEVLVVSQNGVCAICRKAPRRHFDIDHEHKTTRVRGLLCGKCNRGVGLFCDSPVLLRRAAAYLEGALDE